MEAVGIIAGTLTSISLMPQLIKTFKTKKAEEISLAMLLVLMFGVALWVYYGFLRKDLPIIVTNLFSMVLNIMLLGLRWKFAK